jgi:RHS repeat-associated protein
MAMSRLKDAAWARRFAAVVAALVVCSIVSTGAALAASASPTSSSPPTFSSDSAASAAALESAGVRSAIAHETQGSGPLVVTEGGKGDTSAPQAPAGAEAVPSLSTAFSNTWRKRGGSLISRIYPAPVNFKGNDGAWHAIGNRLVPTALDGYQNEANAFALQVPLSLSTGMSLSHEGSSLTFALQGGKEVLPAVEGSVARYAEALKSTDFEYQSTSTGVEETATLKNAEAPSALSFTLSASPGLSARAESDGSVELVDAQGDVAFRIPAPVASLPGEESSAGRTLPVTLTPNGSGWLLSVDTSAPWLRAALASGPIAVDPTVEVGGSQNCWIESDSPKSSFCSQSSFDVGYQSEAPAHEHHGLLKFNLSSLPASANVFNAKLGMFVQSKSTTTAKPIGVYRVTKPWTTGATWESYDGTNAWSTAGGDYNNPAENSDASVNPSVGASTGWYYWYPTKMVQEWVNGTSAGSQGAENDGLIVKDQTDNSINNVLSFDSIRASSDQPFLEVFYEPLGYGKQQQFTTISTPLTDRSTMSVNVASGNLDVESDDLQMGGVDGLGFTSEHLWNSLNPEEQEYGDWTDSNALGAQIWGDGSVTVNDGLGGHFTFLKKPEGGFITPPGIKATLCAAGSLTPCPSTLPSGVSYRLLYDQSQDYYDYNSEGAKLYEKDRYGNTVSHEYASHTKQTFTDTHGHKIEELSNAETWITEIKDLSGARTTKYTYEKVEGGQTELATYTDANGKVTHYGYTGNTLTSITDPTGEVTKFAYDGQHRVTEIVRTTNTEHTKGPTTKFTYDEVGHAPSPCTSTQKATIVKDPDWSEAKPKKHETTYCSNVLDEVEKTVDAEGHETSAKYNAFGDQTATTAAAPGGGESGNVLSSVYDGGGRNLLCQISGTNSEESSCPSRPDKTAVVSTYSYRGGNTPFSSTQQENAQNNSTFNCFSQEGQEAKKEEEPACTAESGPQGTLQTRSDQLSEQKTLAFTYNTNGTVKTSTDADGHTTEYGYDEHGNLKEIKPPSPLGATTIAVDADSRPEVITDGAGHKATITYDPLDRITKVIYSGGGATERTVKFAYDADGNVTSREDPTGTTKYKTDQLNRVLKEELPGSVSNEYGYDEASNMTSFIDSGGTTTYAYNGLNELESMTEPSAAKATTFTYDGDKRITSITYPSGAKDSFKLEPTTGRPEKVTAEGTKGTTVPAFTYGYKLSENDTGLIQSVNDSSGNETVYSYDQLDRLVKAVTKGTNPSFYKFKLDGAGNRVEQKANLTKAEEAGSETTSYAYNSANELECRQTVAPPCSGSATTELSHYSYDAAGEQTAITPKADTTGAAFTYNAASELSKLTPSGGSELSLSFGGTGQDDLVGLGSTSLQNSLLGLTKETNGASTSYFARTPAGLLVDVRTPSGSYNPLYDAQGDVVGLAGSTAKVERTFRYGPFGENTTSAGTQTIPYPFGFKAGYRMPGGNSGKGNVANGLYHFGQRYYDPTTGRWTQQDPADRISSPVQANRFLFAGGDGVSQADPTGLELLEEVEEGAEEAGEYAVAGLEGCVKGAAESTLEAGPDAAEGGCGFGAASSVAKKAGCDACADAIDIVGAAKDEEDADE